MASLRLTCLLREALSRPSVVQRTLLSSSAKTLLETTSKCGLVTSASRLRREIEIVEPDKDDEERRVARTDKQGKLAEMNDPFDLKIVARTGDGSKDSPDLIPSMFNRRIVGHICEEDQSHITWFYLYKGEPQMCQCGHWFKLVPVDPL